jgi:CheY-like chemotaxis protein
MTPWSPFGAVGIFMKLLSPKFILLAEDDANVREISTLILEKEGHHVEGVANGSIALERLLRDMSFDLLFSDISMPGGIDGIQLARRSQGAFPTLQIILASGHAKGSFTDFPEGLRFLPKPYDRQSLLAAVSEAFP